MADPADKTTLANSGSLSSVFRRFALRATLTMGVLGVTGPTGAGDAGSNRPAVQNVDETPGTAPPKGQVLSVREKKRRASIRETLLDDARAHLDTLEDGSATGYTHELQGLGDSLTANLHANHSTVHNRVAFVDPQKFDVALSLGFAPEYAVQSQLASRHIQMTDKQLMLAGDKMAEGFTSKFGVKTYAEEPTAVTNMKGLTAEACVVVPSSEHALQVDIPGMTRAEIVDYTNRHESWHCMDDRYNLRHLDPKAVVAVKPGGLFQNAHNKTALEIFAIAQKKEAFADAGAVGDMIRKEGRGLDVIDKISGWRAASVAGQAEELDHFSAPVLDGLKQRIQDMGIDKFRTLSDKDAEKLYAAVTDEHAMSGKSVETMVAIAGAKTGQERVQLAQDAVMSAEGKKAVVALGALLEKPIKQAPLTAQEQAAAAQLKNWDADKLLDDKAFAQGKKITPATLITAYNTLQEDLRHKMKDDPSNPLFPAQADKLQQSFLTHARNLDYVQANADRGVDIVRAEPALKSYAAAKPGATAPAAG